MEEYNMIDDYDDPFYTGNPIPQCKSYIVYVKTDDANCITAVNSSAFLLDTDRWIEIDSGYGDKYHHAQGNYFPKRIRDERGIKRYKVAIDPHDEDGHFHTFEHDGVVYGIYERSHEEMDAEYAARPAPPPSDKERIAALEAQLAAYEAAYAEGVNEA